MKLSELINHLQRELCENGDGVLYRHTGRHRVVYGVRPRVDHHLTPPGVPDWYDLDVMDYDTEPTYCRVEDDGRLTPITEGSDSAV